jgi:hypothetical protein
METMSQNGRKENEQNAHVDADEKPVSIIYDKNTYEAHLSPVYLRFDGYGPCPIHKVFNTTAKERTTGPFFYFSVWSDTSIVSYLRKTGRLALTHRCYTAYVDPPPGTAWSSIFKELHRQKEELHQQKEREILHKQDTTKIEHVVDEISNSLVDNLIAYMEKTTVEVHNANQENETMSLQKACTKLQVDVKLRVANALIKLDSSEPKPLGSAITQLQQTLARITLHI